MPELPCENETRKTMTKNEIETPSVQPTSWRDNMAVLRLVRIGFLLQFYIPVIVCCICICTSFVWRNEVVGGYVFFFGIFTLILLAVQCSFFTWVLRLEKLRFACHVLLSFIVINVIHSIVWLCLGWWPMTVVRLTPPTILYLIAAIIELTRTVSNIVHSHPQTDSP